MTGRVQDKVAVVTGGCSGIGLAAVRRLAAEGARIVIGDIDDQRGPEVAAEIGGRYRHTDVTDADQVGALFAAAVDAYGSLDIAFNNAGISPPEDDSILDTDLDAWHWVQQVNLTSVNLCCKAALSIMTEQQRGSIINTASFVAVIGAATSQISYSASKGGVLSMTRELGVQFARSGIRVNALCARARSTPRSCRNSSPQIPSGPPAGWSTSRWAGSPNRRRSPTPYCSWPRTSPASSRPAPSWSTAASPPLT